MGTRLQLQHRVSVLVLFPSPPDHSSLHSCLMSHPRPTRIDFQVSVGVAGSRINYYRLEIIYALKSCDISYGGIRFKSQNREIKMTWRVPKNGHKPKIAIRATRLKSPHNFLIIFVRYFPGRKVVFDPGLITVWFSMEESDTNHKNREIKTTLNQKINTWDMRR